MADNILRRGLANGEFVYSAELVLGRDHSIPDVEQFVRDAAKEPQGVKIISLTDLPGGNPALPPEASAALVMEYGLTPIAHLSGKDGNRSFIEARLHSIARMGVENVLALTGDAQKEAFSGKPKPVYDMDSVLILQLIEALKEGISYQLGSRTVKTTPFDFFAGAVVNPFKVREQDQMMQLYKLELKIAVGAKYIITQLGYNLRKLYELKQYMEREGIGHIPVLANVYVPTATIARMMQSGEVAGCVISDELIKRLEGEKKPQRLERAALMVACVRELGFAGAHIGGFGLNHADFMRIIERSCEIGSDWRKHMDELIFETPNEFYLLPKGSDGFSESSKPYQAGKSRPNLPLGVKVMSAINRLLIADGSIGDRIVGCRLRKRKEGSKDESWRGGFWYKLVALADVFKRRAVGCVECGDCLQDYICYAPCTMGNCYKETRNGPCGGSRLDGTCEVKPEQQCVWNEVYLHCLAMGKDPRQFARTLVPPRNWELNRTNSLANRMVGVDNYPKRRKATVEKLQTVDKEEKEEREEKEVAS